VCLFGATAHAQESRETRVEIGGYGGYLFGGSAESHSGVLTSEASIDAAPSYGGFLDFRVRPDALAEISYSRHPSTLSLRRSDGTFGSYDMLTQYFQIGGLLEFKVPRAEWFRPVFGGTLGATVFTADTALHSYDEWRFSLILEGGAKFRVIDHFGLRFRARMFLTFLTDDSALFCSSGTGCGFIYSGTAVLQGEVGGGAYFAF
jgi:hypothetical protein